MIIMLNGSFGVGKTTVAKALVKALPNAVLYDPELIGYVLRRLPIRLWPKAEVTNDFQDISLWRTWTIRLAGLLHRLTRRTLVVPMTLANPAYLAQIRTGFKRIDPKLYHFCLTASLETIQKRLTRRGEDDRDDISWPLGKARLYVPMFSDARYEEHINTETRSIEEIVRIILARVS